MSRSIVLSMALLCPLAALAADRQIPYADLHDMFARLAKAQGGTYLKVSGRLESKDPAVPTEKVKLLIRSRRGEIAVPVAADGGVDFPMREDLLAENPPVVTNVGKGKLAFYVSIRIDAPLAQRFQYGVMVAMQNEAAAMIKKQGMMARLFGPSYGGLEIHYAPGTRANATVEAAQGSVRFETDAKGAIKIPDRRDWRKENPFVQLSAIPTQITLQMK